MKRIATNSMMETGKRCKEQFALRYVDGLVPARSARSPSFGSLFHLLIQSWWMSHPRYVPPPTMTVNGVKVERLLLTPLGAVEMWRNERIKAAEEHAEQVQAQLGIRDDGLVTSVKEQCADISSACLELFRHFLKEVLEPEASAYEPLFVEEPFNVPLLTRDQRRHPVWRYRGKYDLVLREVATGQTILRDYKTTVRQPTDMASILELDTQPMGYVYAALYLATTPRVGEETEADEPTWPEDAPAPVGFELEVIRKKVPREPPLLKSGRLSKAQNVDTTPELFEAAIQRHGLDPADYDEILLRLRRRGPAFHYRHRVAVGPQEISRWVHETRLVLEDLRRVELHRDQAYRASPSTCQRQYGRRCVYHPLCFGDAQMARADFIKKPVHDELEDETLPDETSQE